MLMSSKVWLWAFQSTMFAVGGMRLLPRCFFSTSQIKTSRSASLYGSGRNKRALITLKIVVLAPIPSARETTATKVIPGVFQSIRMPYRRSCQIICIGSPRAK